MQHIFEILGPYNAPIEPPRGTQHPGHPHRPTAQAALTQQGTPEHTKCGIPYACVNVPANIALVTRIIIKLKGKYSGMFCFFFAILVVTIIERIA